MSRRRCSHRRGCLFAAQTLPNGLDLNSAPYPAAGVTVLAAHEHASSQWFDKQHKKSNGTTDKIELRTPSVLSQRSRPTVALARPPACEDCVKNRVWKRAQSCVMLCDDKPNIAQVSTKRPGFPGLLRFRRTLHRIFGMTYKAQYKGNSRDSNKYQQESYIFFLHVGYDLLSDGW